MSFLSTVTGRTGFNVLTGPNKTDTDAHKWVHRWVDFSNVERTQQILDDLIYKCSTVYFGLGAFEKDANGRLSRKATQCKALKSFWLDVDCGEEKWEKHGGKGCYRTRREGIKAFKLFLTQTGLPAPTYIISSGAGMHVYWAMDNEVETSLWRECAQILKDAHIHYGFEADKTRTADPASVLRPIGTQHHNGNFVSILKSTDNIFSSEKFIATLQEIGAGIPRTTTSAHKSEKEKELDRIFANAKDYIATADSDLAINSDITQDVPTSFEKIINMQKLEHSGCAQILDLYENQEETPEPLWAAGLSICKFCDDGEKWSIKMSENHPEYDYDKMVQKREQWGAPRTCAWFNAERPELCKGCPHAIGMRDNPNQSPIRLALNPDEGPTVVKAKIAHANTVGAMPVSEEETFVIPSMPDGFSRDSEHGGIYKLVPSEEGDDGQMQFDKTLIYPYDFYIYQRIGSGLDGKPTFWARLHSPHDGVMEMELTTDDVYAQPAQLAQKLAAKGVLTDNSCNLKWLSQYVKASVTKHMREQAMLKPPMQLGWTENGSFILGRNEYTKAGVKMSPVSDTNIARNFGLATKMRKDAGENLQGWNASLQKLYGADDAGTYRLLLAAGMGAAARSRHGDEVGGILNIYSEESGLGKTTLSKVIAGVYGEPDPFVLQAKHGTTAVAFFETISYVNSLPLVLDETGQLDPYNLMEFVHTCTSGKPKLRGTASANDVRQTLPGWRSFVLSSSNVSLWNRITEARHENEAYLMRIAEVPIKPLAQTGDKRFGDEAVREMQKHYGVPAPFLINYMVMHDEEIGEMWRKTNADLSRDAKLRSPHRFWADIMTSAVVGAYIGSACGVYPFDPTEVYALAVANLKGMVARSSNKVVDDKDLFAEFATTNLDATVIVTSDNAKMAYKLPSRKVGIRIETETNMMYVNTVLLRDFARDKQFGIERIEGYLKDIGGKPGVYKNLLAGTELQNTSPSIRTWQIDLSKTDLDLNTEDLIDG